MKVQQVALNTKSSNKYKTSPVSRGIAAGYRSGLEELVSVQLRDAGIKFGYESTKIEYIQPTTKHKYTPDFLILSNGIIVETKGRFVTADRKKHLLIQDQHPEHDIRFVFSNSKTRISKTSKTTYADWCNHKGFKFADKLIPTAWLLEKGNTHD